METKLITKADLNEKNEYAGSDGLEFNGHVKIDANLGRVRFRTFIRVAGVLISEAGSGIKAGWGIKAGSGIKAG